MTTSKQAPALPDATTAYQTLFDNIHQQVFFNKMAAYGHGVRDQQHAARMLDQAGKLRHLEEVELMKQASAADDPYVAAGDYLDQHLASMGYATKTAGYPSEEEMAIKAAAADFASVPEIYNSVLSLKAWEAEQLQQQG